MQQSCYYQRLRSVFYELLNYEPNDRGTTSKVVQLLEPKKLISYIPLSVSLAKRQAVEKHDEKLIEENFDFAAIMIFQIMMGQTVAVTYL